MSSIRLSPAVQRNRRTLLGFISALALGVSSLLPMPAAAQDRTLETAFGPVTVKGEVQRVITLDEGALDTVLALGMQPAGSVAARGAKELPNYLQERASNVPIVGVTREPNMEAIFAQRPDLIFASPGLEKRVYDILSKMAPTIVPTTPTTAPWTERNALYVEALGKQAEMEKLIAEVEARIEAMRARIEPGQTFSVVRWMPQGPMAMSSKLITGQLLSALGMKSTEPAEALGDRPHSDILSLENLGSVDADWVFLATLNEQGDATLAAAREQPAFTRLSAARNGRAVPVDGQVWSSGTGVLAANRILDDVERIVLKP